jgi:hypothetical protein
MDRIASQIVQNDACGQDIEEENPLALEALEGIRNYLLYYGAGCLKDNTTNIYCTALSSFARPRCVISLLFSFYHLLLASADFYKATHSP